MSLCDEKVSKGKVMANLAWAAMGLSLMATWVLALLGMEMHPLVATTVVFAAVASVLQIRTYSVRVISVIRAFQGERLEAPVETGEPRLRSVPKGARESF